MKKFYYIFRKEIKELLTKQMIMGLAFTVVLFGMMGKFTSGVQKEMAKPINVAVLDLDKSDYSKNILNKLATYENVKVEIVKGIDTKEAIEETKEKGVPILLVITTGFQKNIREMKGTELEVYSIIKGFGFKEMSASETLVNLMNSINKEISGQFIHTAYPDKNPDDIANPLKLKEFVVVRYKIAAGNPATIKSLTISYVAMIPAILMMLIMYAGIMVITSMGLEKENKTLETLLTLPVKRTSIIVGKMAGAAAVAFLMAAVYMLGFRYFMASFTPNIPGGKEILENLGLVMTPLSYILLGISLFLAIIVALSMCILLGIFAQDTKSAQSMTMPIILLLMIPYFILLFQDIETLSFGQKILLYAIPFSHPFIASHVLLFRNYSLVIGGIVYMVILTLILIYVAVRIFNTDKVLTAKISLKRRKKLNPF